MTAQALLVSGGDTGHFARSVAWRLRWWLFGLPAGVGLATLRSILKLWMGWTAARAGILNYVRRYEYVGPAEIKARVADDEPGTEVRSCADLERWLSAEGQGESVTCTFVIDLRGVFRIADRHSEHVACVGGEAVLSAGEMTFARVWRGWEVEAVTNQSTGYCPESESWSAVAAALEAAGLEHPGGWTDELIFRKCERCGERNIVKEGWFVCDVCNLELPRAWNFAIGPTRDA